MTRGTTFVGMDVHKASISVAVLEPGKQVPTEWVVENRASLVAKLGQKLKRDYGEDVTCCYEAGPCGFAQMRDLSSMGINCKVIAPALIPKQPGNRVKTDRRDAQRLASLFQAGLLTEVHPPTAAQEAVRDLCRARDDARDERLRAQHRLVKFLLRHGLTFAGATQTRRFHQWLSKLTFEHAAAQATFDHYVRTLVAAQERQKSLDEKIEEIAGTPEYQAAVGMLRCFRGIDTTSAMIILSELGDITRFESPRQLMAFLGITPSEYSSGGKEKRGGITKTGNRHVRRLLVEAAWHYRHHSSVGKELQARRRGQPGWAVNLAEKCQLRLCRRHRRLVERGKAVNKANIAVARELAGFIWAGLMAHEERARAA